jgi:hypothetical protein
MPARQIAFLLPYGRPAQDLVELLKMPTCLGRARKVVLKHIGSRYGHTFASPKPPARR